MSPFRSNGSARPCPAAVLLAGAASGQAASRTGQNGPPPLPPAGSLSPPGMLKQQAVPWLPAQPKAGLQRRGRKHPSRVSNRERLTAHWIFCNFISVPSWPPRSARLQVPPWEVPGAPAGTAPGRSPVTIANSLEAKMEFFLRVPRLSASFLFPPQGRAGK